MRPKGYVADRAVVRRVGGRDLFLGNALAAHPDEHDLSFDSVLSATDEERPFTTHHHPLTDGPGIESRSFEAAVDDARRLYRRDGRVLIHCRAGISRSAALVATALAAEEGRAFADALDEVHEARPLAMPHPALHESGVVYLAANA